MAPTSGTFKACQHQVRLQEARERSRSRPLSFLDVVVRGSAKQQLAQQQIRMSLRPDTSARSLAGDFHAFVGELFLSNKLSGSDTKELASRDTSACARSVERMAQAGAFWPILWQHQPRLDANFDAKLQDAKPSVPRHSGWDCKRGQATTYSMPFLLVHEVLSGLASKIGAVLVACFKNYRIESKRITVQQCLLDVCCIESKYVVAKFRPRVVEIEKDLCFSTMFTCCVRSRVNPTRRRSTNACASVEKKQNEKKKKNMREERLISLQKKSTVMTCSTSTSTVSP